MVNNISSKKHFLLNIVLLAFLVICIIFPKDPYKLKVPLLLLFLVLSLVCFLNNINRNVYIPIFAFVTIFPLLCFVQSLSNGVEIVTIFRNIYLPFMILITIPVVALNLKFNAFFIFLLKVLAILTVGVVVLDVAGISPINGGFAQSSFESLGIGGIIKIPTFITSYKVFLFACPLLIFLLDNQLRRRHYIWSIITVIALILTGTRANWLGLAIYSLYFVFFGRYIDGRRVFSKLFKITVLVLLGILTISIIPIVIKNVINNSFSVSSDSIKLAQIEWFLNEFEDLKILVFGKGFGTAVYDPMRNKVVYEVEMSSFYFLYQVGFLPFVIFLFFIAYPIISRWLPSNIKIAYLCFMISALTNPILTSSTAYIVYLFLYVNIYTNKAKAKQTMPVVQMKEELAYATK